jgi:hypothetical protein
VDPTPTTACTWEVRGRKTPKRVRHGLAALGEEVMFPTYLSSTEARVSPTTTITTTTQTITCIAYIEL